MKEKVIGLVSGGIDSPVANLIISKKFELVPLHLSLYPMATLENSIKSIEILKEIKESTNFKKAIIYPWAGILKKIKSKIRQEYACVICRKSMLFTASKFCEKEKAKGIVTGESLGQKASQTLDNISAITSKTGFPVLRPLIGMNKREIIARSREFGIWNPDHAGCCLAVPSKPRTKARTYEIERELEKIDLPKLIEKNMDLSLEIKDLDWKYEEYLFELASKFD